MPDHELDLTTPRGAIELLRELDAPGKLLAHSERVATIAQSLANLAERLGSLKRVSPLYLGAAALLHDVGKVLVPSELDAPGMDHLIAGEWLLRREGAPPELVSVCRTHHSYIFDGALATEQMLVAIAHDCAQGIQPLPTLRTRLLDKLFDCVSTASSSLKRWEFDDRINTLIARPSSADESPTSIPRPSPKPRSPRVERGESAEELASLLRDLEADAKLFRRAARRTTWTKKLATMIDQIEPGLLDGELVSAGAMVRGVGALPIPRPSSSASREYAGYAVLRREGLSVDLARFCLPRAEGDSTLEELVVVVADECAAGGAWPASLSQLREEFEVNVPGKTEALVSALEALPRQTESTALTRALHLPESSKKRVPRWPMSDTIPLKLVLAIDDMALFSRLHRPLADLSIVTSALHDALDERMKIDAIVLTLTPEGLIPGTFLERLPESVRLRTTEAVAAVVRRDSPQLVHVVRPPGVPILLLSPRGCSLADGVLASIKRAFELAAAGELRRVALVDGSLIAREDIETLARKLRDLLGQLPIAAAPNPISADPPLSAQAMPLRARDDKLICLGAAHEPVLLADGALEPIAVSFKGTTDGAVELLSGSGKVAPQQAPHERWVVVSGLAEGETLALRRGSVTVPLLFEAEPAGAYASRLLTLLDEAGPALPSSAGYRLVGRRGAAKVKLKLEARPRAVDGPADDPSDALLTLALDYRVELPMRIERPMRWSANEAPEREDHALPPAARQLVEELFASWPTQSLTLEPRLLHATGSTQRFTRIGLRGWLAQLEALTRTLLSVLRSDAAAGGDDPISVASASEALTLLERLGATDELLAHARVVRRTAEELTEKLSALGGPTWDAKRVHIGSVLHDVGKLGEPRESRQSGHRDEDHGEELLLRLGLDPAIARICRTYARWNEIDDISIEELLVALAVNLARGARDVTLEHSVASQILSPGDPAWFEEYVQYGEIFDQVARQRERGSQTTAHRAEVPQDRPVERSRAQILLSASDPSWRRTLKILTGDARDIAVVDIALTSAIGVDAIVVRTTPGEPAPRWILGAFAPEHHAQLIAQLDATSQVTLPHRLDSDLGPALLFFARRSSPRAAGA